MAGNFSEMMCALAVLDLPFEAEQPDVSYTEARMEIAPKSPTVVLHQEIKPTPPSAASAGTPRTPGRVPLLVNQSYFRKDDRYEYDGAEQLEKYVTGEMLTTASSSLSSSHSTCRRPVLSGPRGIRRTTGSPSLGSSTR